MRHFSALFSFPAVEMIWPFNISFFYRTCFQFVYTYMIYQLPDFFNDKKLIRGLEFESILAILGVWKQRFQCPKINSQTTFQKRYPLSILYLFLILPFWPDKIFLHRGSGNDLTFQHISAIGTWNKVIEIHQICSFKLKYLASNLFQYIMQCVQNIFHSVKNAKSHFFRMFGQG